MRSVKKESDCVYSVFDTSRLHMYRHADLPFALKISIHLEDNCAIGAVKASQQLVSLYIAFVFVCCQFMCCALLPLFKFSMPLANRT